MKQWTRPRITTWRGRVAVLAALLIAVSVWMLERDERGLVTEWAAVDGTPVTVTRLDDGVAQRRPVVVIAHGFAGSRQLMRPFALSLARNGFVAVSFDFLGHGRSLAPLTGDVTKESGATAALTAQTLRVAAFARSLPGVDGRVALLGHSMASDIVVRAARRDEAVAATIAVSMFSRAVTADEPKNLLIIVGGLERFLTEQALAALRLAAGSEAAEGETYGDPGAGGARRVAVADGVDHVGVLYSRESLAEAVAWVDASLGVQPGAPGGLAIQGPWILALLAGLVALGWPFSALSPALSSPRPAPLGAVGRWLIVVAPPIATPLLLWPAPFDFLPVLVADYLALHFAVYGALTLSLLAIWGAPRPRRPGGRLMGASLAASIFAVGAIGLAVDAYVASFLPQGLRWPVVAALFAGAALYALADAWATFQQPFWMRAATKLAFLLSLAIAVALNLEELFFLAIVAPVIGVFFLLYGLLGLWTRRATGHPTPGALASAAAFAWALGASFPIVAG